MKTTLHSQEKRIIRSMQLLGDETRFKIFKLLTKKQDMCVTEIANELTISPSAVSQHFRQFELLGLVEKHRMGQRICYVLSDEDPLVSELIQLTKQ